MRASSSSIQKIPHSPEVEGAILGCILLAPERAPEFMEKLPRAYLHDERHRLIYRAMEQIVAQGASPDLVTLHQRLGDQIHAAGGVAYLSGLPGLPPGAGHFDDYLAELEPLYARRVLLRLGHEASRLALDAKTDGRYAVEDFIATAQRLRQGQATQEQLRRMLTERRLVADKRPVPAAPVYCLKDIPVATPGNLVAITAEAKAGKTAVVGAMIAATLSDADEIDTLGFASANPEGRALVHFDTEQSEAAHFTCVERAMRRARRGQPPPWLRSYWLSGLNAPECFRLVKQALKDAAGEFNGIHSIIIDGVADLAVDVNDAAECNALVSELHGLAIQYAAPIICVIHFNPGTQKTRGHLGSQLERKAESNLRLDKDGETTLIWSAKQRGAPIPRDKAPAFRWCDTAAMHVSTTAPVRCAKIDTYAAEVEEIFAGRPAMRVTELKAAAMAVLTVSGRTAERRLAIYRQCGLIRRDVANLWISTTCEKSPSLVSPMAVLPPPPPPIFIGGGGGGGGDENRQDSENDGGGGIQVRSFGIAPPESPDHEDDWDYAEARAILKRRCWAGPGQQLGRN